LSGGRGRAGEGDSSGRPFRGCGGIYRMVQGLRPAAPTPGYIPAALFRAPENAGASVDGGRGAGALVARPGHTRATSCNSMMPADAAVWRRVATPLGAGSPPDRWKSSYCVEQFAVQGIDAGPAAASAGWRVAWFGAGVCRWTCGQGFLVATRAGDGFLWPVGRRGVPPAPAGRGMGGWPRTQGVGPRFPRASAWARIRVAFSDR
jgi:hypothetical protein